jgi:hypothetical protein
VNDAGPLVTCGQKTCYSGQVCASGSCAFTGCVGTQVPGDYASLSAALTALGSIGGTICLGPQAFYESISYSAPAAFTIQGVSPSQTSVDTISVSQPVKLTLRGLGISLMNLENASGQIAITDALLGSASSGSQSVNASLGAGSLDLRLDGVEIIGTPAASGRNASGGIYVQQLAGTTFTAHIVSSYFHGAAMGVIYSGTSNTPEPTAISTVVIENNTFDGLVAGLVFDHTPAQASISYFNNLFVNDGTAIQATWMTGLQHGNNALFGNTTNYAGAAVDGPGYLKADPSLDRATTPPTLANGSPCRGAGDAAHAAGDDYWGRPRPGKVDIGATQSP